MTILPALLVLGILLPASSIADQGNLPFGFGVIAARVIAGWSKGEVVQLDAPAPISAPVTPTAA